MSEKNTSSNRDKSANQPNATQPSSDSNVNGKSGQFSPLANRFLWADSASSVQRVINWLGILCAALFALDFIVHRHAYAPGEGLPGFYAIVGFVAFTLIVLGAAQLRRLILRNERYYAPNSIDAESYPESGLERLDHGVDAMVEAQGHANDSSERESSISDQSVSKSDADQGDKT